MATAGGYVTRYSGTDVGNVTNVTRKGGNYFGGTGIVSSF